MFIFNHEAVTLAMKSSTFEIEVNCIISSWDSQRYIIEGYNCLDIRLGKFSFR